MKTLSELPTPLEVVLDPISLLVIAMFIGLFLWETFLPRNKNLPNIKHYMLRGLIAFVFFFFLSSYLPLLTDEFLANYQLINLSGLPIGVQIVSGLVIYQLFLYGWHRSMHSSDFLWRTTHQMHHSLERMDVPSSFYFSPLDMIGFTIMGSLCFALTIGISAQPIMVIILLLNFFSIFQHANINTPRWLGYIIQRPEQHALHHERGVHKYNYCDLPFIDMLFGTYKNPKEFIGKNGFYDGASAEFINMIRFKDLNK